MLSTRSSRCHHDHEQTGWQWRQSLAALPPQCTHAKHETHLRIATACSCRFESTPDSSSLSGLSE